MAQENLKFSMAREILLLGLNKEKKFSVSEKMVKNIWAVMSIAFFVYPSFFKILI